MTATEQASMIGVRLPRVQDDRMLRGHGYYVDDIDEAGVLHAAIIRSPVAAGRLAAFDADAAREAPGVALVLGPDDIEPLVDAVPSSWLLMGQQITDWQIVSRTVRYVGQPLGVVVATSRAAAEDAAELVGMEFDEQPAVVGVPAAQAPGAPLLYPEVGTNQVGQLHVGSPVEELESVFATAAHVIDLTLTVPRISHSPLEPRGIVAEWLPATRQLTISSSTQVPHLVRQEVAHALRIRVDQVRVAAHDVGGSFGQKTTLFPDEGMICVAARMLGRKVKWIEDRSEALTASYQGRGTLSRSRLALDSHGRFLAIHADLHGDVGAFSSSGTGGTGPFQVAGLMIEGPYRYEKAGATISAWYTNAPPTAAFRGYGMQEGTWIRERLVDQAAHELGLDPVELRRANMITADQLPHVTHTGIPFDNGDYPAALAIARSLEAADRSRRGPSSCRPDSQRRCRLP